MTQSLFSLLSGAAGEAPTVTNCVLTADSTITRGDASRSWKMAIAGAVTPTLSLTMADQTVHRWSAFGLLLYVSDAAKVTSLTLTVYTDTGATNRYVANVTNANDATPTGIALVTGWNLLRWTRGTMTTAGAPAAWGTVDHIRLVAVTSGAVDLYVQHVFAELRDKASFVFISDGAYTGFDTSPGYADLLARRIPVTWAPDAGVVGQAGRITEARLAELAAENRNEIDFHGWDASATSAMTAQQVIDATNLATAWLRTRGYPAIWRAAWMQNAATQAPATNGLVFANPMYGVNNVEKINGWPLLNRQNVIRYQLHGRADAVVDGWFTELEANRGVLIGYTHLVNAAGGTDITPAEWAYLLAKIDAGVAAGWLECVTLEELLARDGTAVTPNTLTYVGEDGETTTTGASVIEWWDAVYRDAPPATKLMACMDGIADLIDAGLGGNVFPYPVESITPPAVVVGFPESWDFDAVMARGADEMVYPVWFVVGKSGNLTARNALSDILSDAGSVKDILDGTHTFGAFEVDIRVTAAAVSELSVSGVAYLAAKFDVEVYG